MSFLKILQKIMPLKWALPVYKTLKIIVMSNVDYLGVLSNKEQRYIAKVLDALTFKKGIMDMVDGFMYNGIIKVADNFVVEKYVSEGNQNVLKKAVALTRANDADGLTVLIAEQVNVSNSTILVMGEQAVNFVLAALYEFVGDLDLEVDDSEEEVNNG